MNRFCFNRRGLGFGLDDRQLGGGIKIEQSAYSQVHTGGWSGEIGGEIVNTLCEGKELSHLFRLVIIVGNPNMPLILMLENRGTYLEGGVSPDMW